MKNLKKNSWFLVAAALIMLLSIPAAASQKFQSLMVGIVSPLWKKIGLAKNQSENARIAELELENLLLKNQLEEFKTFAKAPASSLPAKVIYRSPTSWNSTLWINVGSQDNREVIGKNSPVVVGDAIVGVVDLVKEKKSRVRLITDPELTPSVRAYRETEGGPRFLAKGEVHGSANILWRSRGSLLIGDGFNYDYEDEYGPSRDLRDSDTILQVDDLLITTGMDGVFPKGFKVGTVSKIHMLREGDYYYKIEAVPSAANLEELMYVTVLPPLDFE